MTSVNITSTNNTVTVNEGDTSVVTVSTQGPAGPAFTTSGATLDDTAKVNNSIVYFNQSSGTFKADALAPVENLVDGGNF
tara:strand:- start:739 stop:978 length:240 start_codon:yes stop_codon:yes gene_type:complete